MPCSSPRQHSRIPKEGLTRPGGTAKDRPHTLARIYFFTSSSSSSISHLPGSSLGTCNALFGSLLVSRSPNIVALAAPEVVGIQPGKHIAFLGPTSPPIADTFRLQNFLSSIHRPFPSSRRPEDTARRGGDRKRQCFGLGNWSRSGDRVLMSRREPPSDPISTSTQQSQIHELTSASARDPSATEKLLAHESAEGSTPVQNLETVIPPVESRATRPLDVQNILNPTQPGPLEGHQTPQTIDARTSGYLAAPASREDASRPAGIWSGGQVPAARIGPSIRELDGGVASRRILRPKSPALRAASLGRLSLPANIDTQSPASLPTPSRRYLVEPSLSQDPGIPPIPTPPAVSMFSASYGFPSITATPPQARRASLGPLIGGHSQSPSPSTSYSSFTHPAGTSPGLQAGSAGIQPPPWSHKASPFHAAGQGGSAPPTPLPYGSSYRPSAMSWAQGSQQQMLTLDTGQGPIQVPVDVQAASRMADDKRKRNAGASARFRQRRKEKEREASSTIARLEQQIRDLTEEREFYRHERDYFRGIVAGLPGHAPPQPRPMSPARRRSIQSEGASMREAGRPWLDSTVGGETEASGRRRSSAYPSRTMYPLPFPLPPVTSTGALTATEPAGQRRGDDHGPYSPGRFDPSFPPEQNR
ncbi:MAG: hypothetical protein M1816_006185 [Peltula sp. TS41687]|nr:MAG: hypothetical protein M1816_006185 [Peltula sp. TS41687]